MYDLIKGQYYALPILMLVKAITLCAFLYRSWRKISRTNYEYNLWLRIGIENELPPYLKHHRRRMMPEFFRKMSNLIKVEDLLIWMSMVLYVLFLG